MARKLKTDAWLFGGTLVLLAVSMAFVYSASAHRAQLGKNDAEYYLIRQGLWVLLGVALMLVTMRVDYRKWGHPRVIQALVGVTIAGLVAVFFARPVNNAHRWLGIGGVGVQPSEFAKLVVILFAGAVIAGTVSGSGAADAGLTAGDTITALAGKAVNSADALKALVASHDPGDRVQIAWTDASGQSHTATVTLGSGPAD